MKAWKGKGGSFWKTNIRTEDLSSSDDISIASEGEAGPSMNQKMAKYRRRTFTAHPPNGLVLSGSSATEPSLVDLEKGMIASENEK